MNQKDLDTLIICSFRYALGRRTYVVDDVIDLIIKYESKLGDWIKERICYEISYELERKGYTGLGMEMDKEAWIELLAHLSNGIT